MGKAILWLLAAIGGVIVSIVVVGALSVNPNFGTSERGKEICAKAAGNRVIEVWTRQRVIRSIRRSDGRATVEVDTRRWASISQDAKISIGIASFCQAAGKNGRGVSIIKGSLNEDLGSVVDGNWMR